MAKEDKAPVTGHLKVVLKDEHGRVKKREEGYNLIVDYGLDLIANVFSSKGGKSQPSHTAVGDSATSPANGQSALQGNELSRKAHSSETLSSNSITYKASFAAGEGTGTIEEIGIFNDSSAGDMLARFTRTFQKESNDTLDVDYTLTFNR